MTRKPAEAAASLDQVSALTPFELSRVYAKGWLAGMNCDAGISAQTVHAKAEALNPYTVPTERARWMEGFAGAVRRKYGIAADESGNAGAVG
jgi:ribosome modulation factor